MYCVPVFVQVNVAGVRIVFFTGIIIKAPKQLIIKYGY